MPIFFLFSPPPVGRPFRRGDPAVDPHGPHHLSSFLFFPFLSGGGTTIDREGGGSVGGPPPIIRWVSLGHLTPIKAYHTTLPLPPAVPVAPRHLSFPPPGRSPTSTPRGSPTSISGTSGSPPPSCAPPSTARGPHSTLDNRKGPKRRLSK